MSFTPAPGTTSSLAGSQKRSYSEDKMDDTPNVAPVGATSTGPKRQKPRREEYPGGLAGDAAHAKAMADYDATEGAEQRAAIA